MESTKSFEPQVKVEREEEDLGTESEISLMLKRYVVENCSKVKKDEVRPVKELLAKVVQVKSLEKSKDGRDYVTTIIKAQEGN